MRHRLFVALVRSLADTYQNRLNHIAVDIGTGNVGTLEGAKHRMRGHQDMLTSVVRDLTELADYLDGKDTP